MDGQLASSLVRTTRSDESPTSDGGGGGAAVVYFAAEAEEVELDRCCGRHVCVVAACRKETDREQREDRRSLEPWRAPSATYIWQTCAAACLNAK
jgi:hypothetical protein